MKKSLLLLFSLILGMTQIWAQSLAAGDLTAGAVYKVESSQTISGTLNVPQDGTVTIYIAKGKTLTVNSNTAGQPAISVPSNSTLILTGGGTLRVKGGSGAKYATTQGGVGAAPAIGGTGGAGGASKANGADGTGMGTVYVRGNVYVKASRGTSYIRKATTKHGADGAVPSYAIGGGGGGGAGSKGTGKNGATGAIGTLYVEKTARVAYLNGLRRRSNTTSFKIQNKVIVTYNANGGSGSAPSQTINEYGFINVKENNFTYVGNRTEDNGLIQVTSYKFVGWNTAADGSGISYKNKDLILADGLGTSGKKDEITLYAQWDKSDASAYVYYEIWNALQLTRFAYLVDSISGKNNSNAKVMADINMSKDAWNPNNEANWGDWKYWVPIGIDNDVKPSGGYKGTFDGNGYIISNLTMENKMEGATKDDLMSYTPIGYPEYNIKTKGSVNTKWEDSYARAGLIGYANSATIKNVIVKNATLYGRWQVAAVCGRLDGGKIENCGSYGELSLNMASVVQFHDNKKVDLSLSSCVAAGVVTTSNPDIVSSVWSTYNLYNAQNTSKGIASYDDTYTPARNYVVGGWSSSNNTNYCNYTQNSEGNGTKRNWIYVQSTSSATLANGDLCYKLNGNNGGITPWTQTFVNDDDNDPCSYAECPRPTDRGLAVYKDGSNYYNRIYTVTFDSNGGSECDDAYVGRYYNNKSELTYSTLPTSTLDGYSFEGWYTELNGETKVKELNASTVKSDMTLYANWLAGPETITVTANEDPDNRGTFYGSFYYGEQAYRILTADVVAYKAKKTDDKLVMTPLAENVIPAGEAVILRGPSPSVELQATTTDKESDPDNVLYGSDEEINVSEVADVPGELDSSDPEEKPVKSNCYIFTYGTNKLGFYLQPTDKKLAAHRAYILLNEQTSVNFAKYMVMDFGFEEETTGISEFTSKISVKDIHNINGMRLSKLQKGINIIGGKKIFVK